MALFSVEVALVETLEGLEARVDEQCVGLLRNYRDMRKLFGGLVTWNRVLPPVLYFEKPDPADCPRIAVAS